MKKPLLPITLILLSAFTTLAQGTLNYSVRVTGAVVAPVYMHAHDLPTPYGEPYKTGNTSAGFPAGTQVYLGAPLTGSGFSAQLFYAPGLNQPEGSLVAAPGSITTFRTSATFVGTIVPSFQTLAGTSVGGSATLQLRVWENLGGSLTSWASAEPLFALGNIHAGKSPVFNITGLTSNVDPAPPAMTGLRSFNLYWIPEPSTYALLALGGLGWWVCRRKK